ncbi:MAG: peptide deformylase [Patescibacteria group bacterium]
MSILPITFKGEAVLHQPTTPVDLKELPKLQPVINSMIETMHKRNGIGIAANQVGQSMSIAIINHEAWGGTEDVAIINPSLNEAKKTKWFEEGCLSVPGIFGWVQRAERVRVKAYDRHGKKLDIKAKGLLAHVLQHEVDHLKGIVFVDKAERLQSTTTEYAI